jgi:SAM domain (Sterile alpha motif)
VRAAVRACETASMTRAAAWLEELGVGQYAHAFARQSTAFAVISDRTEVDLEKPGIPLGHRKRMFTAISALARASRAADTDQPPLHRLVCRPRDASSPCVCDPVSTTACGMHWRSAATSPLTLLAIADEVIE